MERIPEIPAVEAIKNNNLKLIGELSRDAELEALDAADTSAAGLPLMLLLIIGVSLAAGIMMLIIFLGVGETTVTNTLGNHFTR